MRKAIKALFIINIVVLCICAIVSAAMQRVENQNSANNYYTEVNTEVNTEVTRISFSQSSYELNVNESVRVTVYVYPSDASNRYITFSSSDYSIAAISRDGYITAKKVGVCTITAISDDDPSIRDYCYVTVKDSNISYSITYNLDGGILNSPNPSTYNSNQTITLNNPTKTYYEFAGWTGSNGTTPQTNVTISSGSIGNKVYTANWVPINYSITYNLDGGTNSIDNPISYNIETETFTLSIPSKYGFAFIGWTGSNGNMKQTSVSITKGSYGEKTYTANWEEAIISTMEYFEMSQENTYIKRINTSKVEEYMQNNNCSNIKVIIPNGVITIGRFAFSHHTEIIEVIIPDSVKVIEAQAFAYCSNLSKLTISENVNDIAYNVFEGCELLENIVNGYVYVKTTLNDYFYLTKVIDKSIANIDINSQCKIIGYEAFGACKYLTNVVIPDNIVKIFDSAFVACSNLFSIGIPSGIVKIGKELFSGCNSLNCIKVSINNLIYDSRGDCNAIIETQTNTLISGCNNTTIPNSIKNIGDCAFRGISSLSEINIPNSVVFIGEEAFANCNNLVRLIIPISVTTIKRAAFGSYNNDFYTSIYFESSEWLDGWRNGYYIGDDWVSESIFAGLCRYYFYKENEPTDGYDIYWHYVDGVVTKWE